MRLRTQPVYADRRRPNPCEMRRRARPLQRRRGQHERGALVGPDHHRARLTCFEVWCEIVRLMPASGGAWRFGTVRSRRRRRQYAQGVVGATGDSAGLDDVVDLGDGCFEADPHAPKLPGGAPREHVQPCTIDARQRLHLGVAGAGAVKPPNDKVGQRPGGRRLVHEARVDLAHVVAQPLGGRRQPLTVEDVGHGITARQLRRVQVPPLLG